MTDDELMTALRQALEVNLWTLLAPIESAPQHVVDRAKAAHPARRVSVDLAHEGQR